MGGDVSAYGLADPRTGLWIAGILVAELAAGFLLSRGSSRWLRALAWCVPVGSFIVVERLTASEPAGVRMVAICLALLLGMKAVVALESRLSGDAPLSPIAWAVFGLGWFGMRPAVFGTFPGAGRDGVGELLRKSAVACGMGLVFLTVAVVVSQSTSIERGFSETIVVALPLMIALSLLVHFALFDLLAATWRSRGANTRKLFRCPIVSTSLTEFWGRRWNLAFSEMTAIAVFRPLKGLIGSGAASVAAFLFSGLLHELAISVPVRAGYGRPLLYFGLHAIAMQIEAAGLGRLLHAHPILGRLWTWTWMLLPLPLLFHRPFVEGVLLPIVDG